MIDNPPDFILRLAKKIAPEGYQDVRTSLITDSIYDYRITLEPFLDAGIYLGDSEIHRERNLKISRHCLVFRHFSDWYRPDGKTPWMAMLLDYSICYIQSLCDEDDTNTWAVTPEEAYEQMLQRWEKSLQFKQATFTRLNA